MTHEEIANAWRASIRTSEEPCPEAEEILDALLRVTSTEEREQIVDHIAKCSACATAWRAVNVAIRRC